MAIFKCKMCGGTLEIKDGSTIAECTFCGTKQTIPKLDDERRANLYDRANHFRRNNDYDKAMAIYEQILQDEKTDAEAYWSLVLCKYGIEYVEDYKTHKWLPTINRIQYTSIFADEDYKSAIEYADGYQRDIYETNAKEIDELQKQMLAISQQEKPFDIFICYKETDANGRRTQDSVLAQDLYYQLTNEGYKVFFSRITLEDKLGTAYEPYIFAALNSAKVMVVLGTKTENFTSIWVKNEWSRFLALIKKDHTKVLIPAFRDMDPYDLPEEFSHLQAQDMSKLGFMQDLIRGIKKIISANSPKSAEKETVVVQGNVNIEPLLKRAFIFLEDGNWAEADAYFEKVLDIDPENAQAYLGKFMAKYKISNRDDIRHLVIQIENDTNFKNAIKFSDDYQKKILSSYEQEICKAYKLKQQTEDAERKERQRIEKEKKLAEETEKKIKRNKIKKRVKIISIMLCIVFVLTLTLCLTLPLDREVVDGMIFKRDYYDYELVGTNSKLSENVVIPETIKGVRVSKIGVGAFYGCGGQKSIRIPSTITSIDNLAFFGCSGLTSITIPENVESIGWGAFKNCSNLITIELEDTSTWYCTTNKENWENRTSGSRKNIVKSSTNVTMFTSTYVDCYWYKL